jgi:hypothetical protein
MLNGTQVKNLMHNWGISLGLEGIANNISLILAIIPLLVKHKENFLEIRLANEGLFLATHKLDVSWDIMEEKPLKDDCLCIHKLGMESRSIM